MKGSNRWRILTNSMLSKVLKSHKEVSLKGHCYDRDLDMGEEEGNGVGKSYWVTSLLTVTKITI